MYLEGMQLSEIASHLKLPDGTVRRWKSTKNWDGERTEETNEKANATKELLKTNVVKPSKTLEDVTKDIMSNEELTEQQKAFCIYYASSFNQTQSYIKAYGVSKETAQRIAYKLMQKPNIRYEIERLREAKRTQIISDVDDMVELHMRILFADIGDYTQIETVTIYDKAKKKHYEVDKLRIKPTADLDTQVIQEIKEGKEGISIKLADRHKSQEWLDRFFMLNPLHKHKIAYDNAKLELERKKLEPKVINEEYEYKGIPSTLVAPSFAKVVHDIERQMYNEYVFTGGRGSTKSTFVSLQIMDILEKDEELHACILRQVADTLRGSVYQQLMWAIEKLGLEDRWTGTMSPLEITNVVTGQKIYFRGADDPSKIKSIKVPFGYIGILWFEELDQFEGSGDKTAEESVRTIEQSVIRGGEKAYIFKSFNPPKSANNWANEYIKVRNEKRLVHHSTYLEVPEHWLGRPFIESAEFIKETNPTAYENEYMGVANGVGGNVFDNVFDEEITQEMIDSFDIVYNGNDFGWFPDPNAFVRCAYNSAKHELYIFDEYTTNKKTNAEIARDLIDKHGITGEDLITCDIDHKSIQDFNTLGLLARPSEKGPNSRNYSFKWLQGVRRIVIDSKRCPETYKEFTKYEYARDKSGKVISGYPDGNDHHIDATRYALMQLIKNRIGRTWVDD